MKTAIMTAYGMDVRQIVTDIDSIVTRETTFVIHRVLPSGAKFTLYLPHSYVCALEVVDDEQVEEIYGNDDDDFDMVDAVNARLGEDSSLVEIARFPADAFSPEEFQIALTAAVEAVAGFKADAIVIDDEEDEEPNLKPIEKFELPEDEDKVFDKAVASWNDEGGAGPTDDENKASDAAAEADEGPNNGA